MRVKSFTELYENAVNPGPLTSAFINGHLVIEFLLRRLVIIYDPALATIADELNHFRLVRLNRELGLIDERQEKVLLRINSVRNKFAHQLSYSPTLDELKAIFDAAAGAFSDLTDGIDQGRAQLDACGSLEQVEGWVLPELFVQIAYDLHGIYQSRGGDDDNF